MIPATLRQLAGHLRAIADATWSAYYLFARELTPTESERLLTVANQSQWLAHDLEHKALALEGDRVVT